MYSNKVQLKVLKDFKEIVSNHGFSLSENGDETPHKLTVETAIFVRNLSNSLENSKEIKPATLVDGLKKYCASSENVFKKSLTPTLFVRADSKSAIQIEVDSLIRLLLKIDAIQTDLVDFILDETIKTVSEDEANSVHLRLLLNQLRYLPHIQKGGELTTKLLDILDLCTPENTVEILDLIPDILPDNRYNQAAKLLLKYLNENKENCPTPAILDCLNALNLDENDKKEIQEIVITKILPGNNELLPLFLDFLINETCNSATFKLVRNSIDGAMNCETTPKENFKTLIHCNLKLFVRTRKDFHKNCVEFLKGCGEFKSVDVYLIFLLMSTFKNKKKNVELLLKKKVKDGVLRADLIKNFFEKYVAIPEIHKDLSEILLSTGCSLVRNNCDDGAVISFAADFFKNLFGCEATTAVHRKEILENFLTLIGGNEKKVVQIILEIILALMMEDVKNFTQHTLILMRLLEVMDSFDLDQTKLVFEILCGLACSNFEDDSLMALTDDLHMIIRKQLSSSKKNIKFRGIVGGLALSRYLARKINEKETETETEDFDNSSEISVENLPLGNAQNAAKLIELILKRIEGCHESTGLFYDQSAMILSENVELSTSFCRWLKDIVMKDFLSKFVVDDFDEIEKNDIKFSAQFNLNETTEEGQLIVNIGANSTQNTTNASYNSVAILAPHFRLLRLLVHRTDSNLNSIDALLLSAVVMPQIEDGFDDFDEGQLRQIADCLFHCVNWFRELISAFIATEKLRDKLMNRVSLVMELEQLLGKILIKLPSDYVVPKSYFNASPRVCSPSENKRKSSNSGGNSSKKVKNHNETSVSDTTAVSVVSKKQTKIVKTIEDGHNVKVTFREFDPAFLKLVKFSESEATLIFFLKDFTQKSRIILHKEPFGNCEVLNQVGPEHFIVDCVKILPCLVENLVKIGEKLDEILRENDMIFDAPPMFYESTKKLKSSFSLLLESFYVVLTWPKISEKKNYEKLLQILGALNRKQNDENDLISMNFLCNELTKFFSKFADKCLQISQSVYLVKIIKALIDLAGLKPKNLKEITREFLCKIWYNDEGGLDSGKNYNADLDYLIKTYFGLMKVAEISELVENVLIEVENLKTKNDNLTIFPSINFKNFHIFFANINGALHNSVQKEVSSLTNQGHLDLWKNVTLTMTNLMMIARTLSIRTNLAIFLKKSVAILKIFITHGVPIFEMTFEKNMEQVVEILKTMQTSTRFLHHLCCDSKINRSVSMTPAIPHFKLMLEQLIYKVKALLFANNCQHAFFMGSLKNKDLKGNTQNSEDGTGEENDGGNNDEEEDEDLLNDDEEDEVVYDESLDNRSNKSDSEVF